MVSFSFYFLINSFFRLNLRCNLNTPFHAGCRKSNKMCIRDSVNTLGLCADTIYGYQVTAVDGIMAWVGALAYGFQIYYDFSGYSDMAIGLGAMFGFTIPENFRYPYLSKSVSEFWRRWHISLGSWFREYVYIPLGGSRKGRNRTYWNLVVVFFLTGLWHGARYTFVLWGLYHCAFVLLEKAGLQKWLDKSKVLAVGYCFSTEAPNKKRRNLFRHFSCHLTIILLFFF